MTKDKENKKKYKVSDNLSSIGRKSFTRLVLYALEAKKQVETSIDRHKQTVIS
jgi:hypothetical protein